MKGFIFSALLILIFSCTEEVEKPQEIVWTKEKSSDLGKNLAMQEEIDIKIFLDGHKTWKTIKTGSGLRYYIYREGKGPKADSDLTAEVKYKINLLDGTLCYQTDSLETNFFKIDKSDIETGVQEGIKKMRVGDRAKLIVPSHLGHGLIGDLDKIPPLTVLVIDIELISLKK